MLVREKRLLERSGLDDSMDICASLVLSFSSKLKLTRPRLKGTKPRDKPWTSMKTTQWLSDPTHPIHEIQDDLLPKQYNYLNQIKQYY